MLNSVETIEFINTLVKKENPFLFIIDFDKENNIVLPLDKLSENKIFYKIPGSDNIIAPELWPILQKFDKTPISFIHYEKLFVEVLNEIQLGNTFLLNLTVPTNIESNLNLYDLFIVSQARYKLYYKNEFALFSPESFIKIENNIIKTFPMKGTISAVIPNAREVIINDSKEAAEHATIVDLLRNDLSMVATDVRVKRFRYVEELNTNQAPILQVSSEIRGKLKKNYKENLGDIIFSLLPAGSVTGAPKNKTVDIIKKVELCPRKYYTGIFGVWDTKKLDSAVMIRFIRNEDGELWYHSGGGITFQSDCASEYNEVIEKVYVPIR